MKSIFYFLVILLLSFTACSKAETNQNSIEIYTEFWEFVDQNYIYFKEKDVDWKAVYTRYSGMINEDTSEEELFHIMEASLLELKDNHNRLLSDKREATRFNFKDGYEIHFDASLVQAEYITDSLGSDGYLYWGLLEDNIGYISLPKFNRYGAFKTVFKEMKERRVSRVIIDVRNNGGGDSNNIPTLLGAFVTEKTKLGSYIEKSGPGHEDDSPDVAVYAIPDPNFHFDIPIVVLINRGCYSATSYFAAMMKGLPNITLMGQVTGGGGGGNLGFELSNGWLVAVSVSDFKGKEGQSIENGVSPDVEINNTADDILSGKDKVLEEAMRY